MQQWEYMVKEIDIGFDGLLLKTLNNAGAIGWELTGIYKESGFWYGIFKRPKC